MDEAEQIKAAIFKKLVRQSGPEGTGHWDWISEGEQQDLGPCGLV